MTLTPLLLTASILDAVSKGDGFRTPLDMNINVGKCMEAWSSYTDTTRLTNIDIEIYYIWGYGSISWCGWV